MTNPVTKERNRFIDAYMELQDEAEQLKADKLDLRVECEELAAARQNHLAVIKQQREQIERLTMIVNRFAAGERPDVEPLA